MTTTDPLRVTPRAWPGSHIQNFVQYVIRLSLLSICANFGIKFFKIDFVIEFSCYLTFWPLPRGPGGQAKNKCALVHPTSVRKLQTKFGWILSNSLRGDVTYNFEKRLTKRLTLDDARPPARLLGHHYFIGQIFF